MRLTILGTRGNITPSARNYARHSGILVGARILLDLGEVAYLRHRPRHIFITHLHPDHAASLKGVAVPDAEVYVPERTRRLPAARLITRPVQIGAYRIVPVPTVHSVNVRSVGYVVRKDGRSMFYSSDLVSIDRRYHRRLRQLDLVITEGSFMRRGGLVRVDPATGREFGHAGIPDLIGFFRPFTPRILITHFGSWYYRDIRTSIREIAALGDGVQVGAARDGMIVTI